MGHRECTLAGLGLIITMRNFWQGKRVFLTGHTGFKGSWMALWLSRLGAEVTGFALQPYTVPSLFEQLEIAGRTHSQIGDITVAGDLHHALDDARPDVVFHLAAQSLVLRSYVDTVATWQTNVMGTVNVLEALRDIGRAATVVAITTDKVYRNTETHHAYREGDPLGGIDPYSASKAGSELVISSYQSLFKQENLPIRLASARAGNVIGGGDWCENRLVPDIARALIAGQPLVTRNPGAVRPWQHVLEPLAGYMRLAEALHGDPRFIDAYNFGPDINDNRTVEDVIKEALKTWTGTYNVTDNSNTKHEAGLLMLDIAKAKQELHWAPRWGFARAVEQTMRWYRDVHEGADPIALSLQQITEFEAA